MKYIKGSLLEEERQLSRVIAQLEEAKFQYEDLVKENEEITNSIKENEKTYSEEILPKLNDISQLRDESERIIMETDRKLTEKLLEEVQALQNQKLQ